MEMESEKIFNSQHYSCFVLVGGPLQGADKASHYPATYGDLATQRLENLGYDTKKIVKISVPVEPTGRRTLTGAREVERWLDSSETKVCCVDVFTVGMHARKSWVFFRQTLGDRYQVGIISGTEGRHDRVRFWFFSKTALCTFFRNLAGYAYSELWGLFEGKFYV